MTDKEKIVINRVDVSGCLFYQSNFEEDYDVKIKHFCSNWHNSCESINNSNCYYKQLACKTQECEELKDKVEQLTILGMDLNQSNEILRKSFFTADKNKDDWREKAEKYERALEEIVEAFEYDIEYGSGLHRQILNIINKAKGRE